MLRILVIILLSAAVLPDLIQARGLVGTLNSPISLPEAVIVARPYCNTLNSFGVMNSAFLSRSETFKTLKMKPISPQEVSASSLQALKDSFMQATSVFKNNFELELDSPESLIQTRGRLLASVGYNDKIFGANLKAELQKRSNEDLRWKSALQKLSCALQTCKAQNEVSIVLDTLTLTKNFRKELESALLEQAGESVSVDEMLGGRVIPNERARLRLFSALLNQLGIQNETRWSCNKVDGKLQFSSRLEVPIGKDIWASDTALSSDYTQKSSQICFSSLAKLTELCSTKKGA